MTSRRSRSPRPAPRRADGEPSRLDKIIARNQRPHWSKNPVVLAFAIAVIVIVMLVLAAVSDLGQPRWQPQAAPAPRGNATRVDGVLLRR